MSSHLKYCDPCLVETKNQMTFAIDDFSRSVVKVTLILKLFIFKNNSKQTFYLSKTMKLIGLIFVSKLKFQGFKCVIFFSPLFYLFKKYFKTC